MNGLGNRRKRYHVPLLMGHPGEAFSPRPASCRRGPDSPAGKTGPEPDAARAALPRPGLRRRGRPFARLERPGAGLVGLLHQPPGQRARRPGRRPLVPRHRHRHRLVDGRRPDLDLPRHRPRGSSSRPAATPSGRPVSSSTAAPITCSWRTSGACPPIGAATGTSSTTRAATSSIGNTRASSRSSSERVIDAFVYARPSGGWRMWYKDEANKSHIYAADSEDLYQMDRRRTRGHRQSPGGRGGLLVARAPTGCSSTAGRGWASCARPTS